MGAKPPRLPLATSLNWGFVPSVAGAGGRGVASPPGERRPGLGPAVPSAPGAPSPPRPPTGGGLSRSAAVPPRGGRERLRDSSHLTHTVTHSHSHTHRTGARALSRAQAPLGGHWAEAAHTHSRGERSGAGPSANPAAHTETRLVPGAPGLRAGTHRGCAPRAPTRRFCTWSPHRQESWRPAYPENLPSTRSRHTHPTLGAHLQFLIMEEGFSPKWAIPLTLLLLSYPEQRS